MELSRNNMGFSWQAILLRHLVLGPAAWLAYAYSLIDAAIV